MHFTSVFSLLLAATASLAAPTATDKRATSCSPVGISAQSSSTVVQKFKQFGVVPTLIPSIHPKVAVNVAYGSKQVNLGNEFLTTETLFAPKLSFSAEQGRDPAKTKYSYFLIDPDVPDPNGVAGIKVTYLHWAVSNASPSCINGQMQSTDTFYQSLTPASTAQHRYTFLVYREPAGYKPDLVSLQLRPGFDINAYAGANGLVLVGGNFLREAITNGIIT